MADPQKIPPPPDGSAIVMQSGGIPPPPDGSAVLAQGSQSHTDANGQPWYERYGKKLASSLGIPTSMEELQSAQPSTAEIIGGPAVTTGKMLVNYGKNAVRGLKEGYDETKEAAQNVTEGGDVLPNLVKAGYAGVHAGINAVPIIGPAINTAGEDITKGDYAGAAGGLTGVVGQLAAPKLLKKGSQAATALSDATSDARSWLAQKAVAPLVKTPLGMAMENAKFGRDPAAAIANEGLVGTKQGIIEQTGKRIGELSDATDKTLQNHPNAGAQIDVEPIIDQAITDAQASAKKVGNKAAVNRLSDLQDALKTEFGPIKGTPYEMNNLKRAIGESASQLGAFKHADPLEASAAGAMGDVYSGIKDAVNKEVPEVVPLNERVADLLSAKTALTRNALMDANKSLLDSHTLYSAGAKALKSTLTSAPVRSGVARILNTGNTLDVPDVVSSQPSAATPQGVSVNAQPQTAQAANPTAAAVPPQPANGRSNPSPAVYVPRQPELPVASGTRTDIKVPGSDQSYPAQYEVRELSDVHPSHSGTSFQPNPKYALTNDRDYSNPANQAKVVENSSLEKFDPSYHITDNPDATNGPIVIDSDGHALGGNGRAMILQRVYQHNPEGAAQYRMMLANKSPQFGVDLMQVLGMKQPVLVRKIADADLPHTEKQTAITDFNKVGTAQLTTAERALADSRRVSQGTLDSISARIESQGADATLSDALQGKSGTDILDKLIEDGVVSPQERAGLANENGLTIAGKDRISKLTVGRFFRDPAQMDATPAAIRNKLESIAAPLARVDGVTGWDLTRHVQDALDILEEARAHNLGNVRDVISQSSMFGGGKYSAEAVAMAEQLKNTGTRALTKQMRQYAQDAQDATGQQQTFGAPVTADQAFRDAFGQ